MASVAQPGERAHPAPVRAQKGWNRLGGNSSALPCTSTARCAFNAQLASNHLKTFYQAQNKSRVDRDQHVHSCQDTQQLALISLGCSHTCSHAHKELCTVSLHGYIHILNYIVVISKCNYINCSLNMPGAGMWWCHSQRRHLAFQEHLSSQGWTPCLEHSSCTVEKAWGLKT